MTFRFARASALAGATLLLAAPGIAGAHGLRHHVRHATARCAAIEAGHTPKRLSADQASGLKAACDTYLAAVKSARTTYRTTAKPARTAYRTTAKSLRTQLRTAKQTRRAACAPDRHAQACVDARTAFRTTFKSLRAQLREAWRTYRHAVRPAARTRNAALRAARRAFHAQAAQALGRS